MIRIILPIAILLSASALDQARADSPECFSRAKVLSQAAEKWTPTMEKYAAKTRAVTAKMLAAGDASIGMAYVPEIASMRRKSMRFLDQIDTDLAFYRSNCPLITKAIVPLISTARSSLTEFIAALDEGLETTGN